MYWASLIKFVTKHQNNQTAGFSMVKPLKIGFKDSIGTVASKPQHSDLSSFDQP
jgi:hypothetical protein